jgi:hypothetical protein
MDVVGWIVVAYDAGDYAMVSYHLGMRDGEPSWLAGSCQIRARTGGAPGHFAVSHGDPAIWRTWANAGERPAAIDL